MGTYLLQPRNYVNQCYLISHASPKRFILIVHNAVQYQYCDLVYFRNVLEAYTALFYVPVYFKTIEYCDLVARGPPPSERIQGVY